MKMLYIAKCDQYNNRIVVRANHRWEARMIAAMFFNNQLEIKCEKYDIDVQELDCDVVVDYELANQNE